MWRVVLPDNDLSDDLADEQGVGHASADGCGVLLWIFFLEEDIGHSPWRLLA
jgi:hypothetical protein